MEDFETITKVMYEEAIAEENLIEPDETEKRRIERRFARAKILVTYISATKQLMIGDTPVWGIVNTTKDMWFYTYISSRGYFKCDGYVGLLRCLAECFPIKIA